MIAKRKGTENPFRRVEKVQLEGMDILYSADVMEFEHDGLSTELKTYNQMEEGKHWQEIREMAAIAAMPMCHAVATNVLMRGGSLTEKTLTEQVAKNAVEYADALINQLKQKTNEKG